MHARRIAITAAGLILLASGAFAGPPSLNDSSGFVTGTVRYVNLQQGVVILQDGTELRATGPHQLDALQEGRRARFTFEQTVDRKLIRTVQPES